MPARIARRRRRAAAAAAPPPPARLSNYDRRTQSIGLRTLSRRLKLRPAHSRNLSYDRRTRTFRTFRTFRTCRTFRTFLRTSRTTLDRTCSLRTGTGTGYSCRYRYRYRVQLLASSTASTGQYRYYIHVQYGSTWLYVLCKAGRGAYVRAVFEYTVALASYGSPPTVGLLSSP
jgi:hypothetical protein